MGVVRIVIFVCLERFADFKQLQQILSINSRRLLSILYLLLSRINLPNKDLTILDLKDFVPLYIIGIFLFVKKRHPSPWLRIGFYKKKKLSLSLLLSLQFTNKSS